MTDQIKLTPPLDDEDVSRLNAGDRVLLSGTIYTGRDAAHQRIVQALQTGGEPPFPWRARSSSTWGPARRLPAG